MYNFTADAHPIHIHEIEFQLFNRQDLVNGQPTGPLIPPTPEERGFIDTVIALPGQITRVKVHFPTPGLFVWHCHIIEHEDNEMMRPYHIGPIPPDLPDI
ncbi:MAG: multicopper oxidase domain-containing protein [Minicystis sp.]